MAAVPNADLIDIVGTHLKEFRVALRLSGPKLSQVSGVSQATISRIERGLTRVEPSTFDGLVYAMTKLGNVAKVDAEGYLRGDRHTLRLSPIMDRR